MTTGEMMYSDSLIGLAQADALLDGLGLTGLAVAHDAEQQSTAQHGGTPWGVKASQGQRKEMEDAYSVQMQPCPLPEPLAESSDTHAASPPAQAAIPLLPEDLAVLSVFDGHGGFEVADHCREALHKHFTASLSMQRQTAAAGHAAPNPDGTFQQQPSHSDSSQTLSALELELSAQQFHSDQVSAALRSAFLATDNDLLGTDAGEFVGATAVVAVIGRSNIWVAHCGDSRAVIQRNGAPEVLTRDHKPDREDEMARIKGAGGKIVYNAGSYRVMGMLAMSRAIGDHFLRPYVIADPEVTCVERTPLDEVLVLATDGLWDVFSCKEATTLAQRCITRSKERGMSRHGACRVAASVLTKVALERGSRDNITVIVVDITTGHHGHHGQSQTAHGQSQRPLSLQGSLAGPSLAHAQPAPVQLEPTQQQQQAEGEEGQQQEPHSQVAPSGIDAGAGPESGAAQGEGQSSEADAVAPPDPGGQGEQAAQIPQPVSASVGVPGPGPGSPCGTGPGTGSRVPVAGLHVADGRAGVPAGFGVPGPLAAVAAVGGPLRPTSVPLPPQPSTAAAAPPRRSLADDGHAHQQSEHNSSAGVSMTRRITTDDGGPGVSAAGGGGPNSTSGVKPASSGSEQGPGSKTGGAAPSITSRQSFSVSTCTWVKSGTTAPPAPGTVPPVAGDESRLYGRTSSATQASSYKLAITDRPGSSENGAAALTPCDVLPRLPRISTSGQAPQHCASVPAHHRLAHTTLLDSAVHPVARASASNISWGQGVGGLEVIGPPSAARAPLELGRSISQQVSRSHSRTASPTGSLQHPIVAGTLARLLAPPVLVAAVGRLSRRNSTLREMSGEQAVEKGPPSNESASAAQVPVNQGEVGQGQGAVATAGGGRPRVRQKVVRRIPTNVGGGWVEGGPCSGGQTPAAAIGELRFVVDSRAEESSRVGESSRIGESESDVDLSVDGLADVPSELAL